MAVCSIDARGGELQRGLHARSISRTPEPRKRLIQVCSLLAMHAYWFKTHIRIAFQQKLYVVAQEQARLTTQYYRSSENFNGTSANSQLAYLRALIMHCMYCMYKHTFKYLRNFSGVLRFIKPLARTQVRNRISYFDELESSCSFKRQKFFGLMISKVSLCLEMIRPNYVLQFRALQTFNDKNKLHLEI